MRPVSGLLLKRAVSNPCQIFGRDYQLYDLLGVRQIIALKVPEKRVLRNFERMGETRFWLACTLNCGELVRLFRINPISANPPPSA